MGRHQLDSSPEVEIKVHPRRSCDNHHSPSPQPRRSRPPRPPPPPSSYQPFKKWFPWLVPTTVIVNIALFVYSLYRNDCPKKSQRCLFEDILGRFAFQPTKENPLLGPSVKTLLQMGALKWTNVVQQHQIWRIASCMWLHAGVVHVVANMVSLVFVGIRLEQEFGFARIGLLYVLSGIGGSLLSALFIRYSVSVGASGALFGLLGGMLSELLTNWTIYANKFAALMTLILIIGVNLAVGILPHVDNFAHLGGFVTGFFLGFVVLVRPQYGWVNHKSAPPGYFAPAPKSKYKAYQYVLFFLSLIVLVAGFAIGLLALLKGIDGNEHCSWCHYLSCVPTPFWKCDDQCMLGDQIMNNITLTCLGNGKSHTYTLTSDGNATAEVAQLCTKLCHH